MTLGKDHTCGIQPERVPAVMAAHLANEAIFYPECLGTTLSMPARISTQALQFASYSSVNAFWSVYYTDSLLSHPSECANLCLANSECGFFTWLGRGWGWTT
jgi:hypothetical protein